MWVRIASWDEDVVVAWVLIEMEGDVAAPDRVLAAAGVGAEAETETGVLAVVVDAVGVVVVVVVAITAVMADGVVAEVGVGGQCARLGLRASVGRGVGSMAGRWGRWMGIE